MNSTNQALEGCLAYAVLTDTTAWLGAPSPRALQRLLSGAAARAELSDPQLARGRIYGPLTLEAFSTPLVARTGNPELEIGWATALEFIYFSHADAMAELRTLVESWLATHGVVTEEPVGSMLCLDGETPVTEEEFWPLLESRPGMLLGATTGSSLLARARSSEGRLAERQSN